MKNSRFLVEISSFTHFYKNDILVSFDVESFLTKIPVEEDSLYKPKDGVAMGSLLRSVFVNFFMES